MSRSRSWLVVGAWVAVLAGTAGVGLLAKSPNGSIAAPTPSPLAAGVPTDRPAAPVPRAPTPTRPPIGEDGVMGGLPFGTAWLWLEAPGSHRGRSE